MRRHTNVSGQQHSEAGPRVSKDQFLNGVKESSIVEIGALQGAPISWLDLFSLSEAADLSHGGYNQQVCDQLRSFPCNSFRQIGALLRTKAAIYSDQHVDSWRGPWHLAIGQSAAILGLSSTKPARSQKLHSNQDGIRPRQASAVALRTRQSG